ncbi:hypothetical protein AVEN_244060-1 [Araneus ventricosus]|uniref:Uncharacterized protein n=1 Tax=Araneus ventricosus TaxID=182803 RepID=A0A4Y2IHF6_ARAVE|nr:hypothetical protein AVEN_244060-1 [Araneus ventricosus]
MHKLGTTDTRPSIGGYGSLWLLVEWGLLPAAITVCSQDSANKPSLSYVFPSKASQNRSELRRKRLLESKTEKIHLLIRELDKIFINSQNRKYFDSRYFRILNFIGEDMIQ